jgi:hypothetical protein
MQNSIGEFLEQGLLDFWSKDFWTKEQGQNHHALVSQVIVSIHQGIPEKTVMT